MNTGVALGLGLRCIGWGSLRRVNAGIEFFLARSLLDLAEMKRRHPSGYTTVQTALSVGLLALLGGRAFSDLGTATEQSVVGSARSLAPQGVTPSPVALGSSALAGRVGALAGIGKRWVDAVSAAPTNIEEYGKMYATLQQVFNTISSETLARHEVFASILSGRAPYWDLVADDPLLRLYGDVARSGLGNGEQVRVYAHYADDATDLASLGPPSGHVPAMLTSSYRTLVLFPEGKVPFMLKLDGSWNEKNLPARRFASKKLYPYEVKYSVLHAERLGSRSHVLAESAGVSLRLPNDTLDMIHRPLPVADDGFRHGDVVAPLHVFLDDRLVEAPLLDQWGIFDEVLRAGRLSESVRLRRRRALERWRVAELNPAIVGLLAETALGDGMHPTLHQQNIDVLVRKGKVIGVFAKDLLDIQGDPALQVALGRDTPTAGPLRGFAANSNIGETTQVQTIEQWHERYYLGNYLPSDARSRSQLRARALQELEVLGETRAMYELPDVDGVNMANYLASLREVLVAAGLHHRFSTEHASEAEALLRAAAEQELTTSWMARAEDGAIGSEGWRFGTIERPQSAPRVYAGLRFDEQGRVADYALLVP